MEDSNKRNFSPTVSVIWSGGFDSTALVIKYLLEGHFVELITFELRNVLDFEQERIARENILQYLKNEFGNQITGHKISKFELDVSNSISFLDGGQAPVWASQAAFALNSLKAAFGYVVTDCMWHIKSDFEVVFHTTAKLCNKTIELIFPFEFLSKEQIFFLYYFERKNLFDMLWVNCETGKHWKEERCQKAIEMQRLNEKFYTNAVVEYHI